MEKSDKEILEKNQPELLIDIEKVFANKNSKLLKFIPSFVIRYLKRITHQHEVNMIIAENIDKKGLPFARAVLNDFGVTYNTIGLEKISINGRYLFASNHPIGGMDGIALIAAVGDKFSNMLFPVNDILMNIKGLDTIFIPINKHGSHPREAAKQMEEAYMSEAQMLMFPAGLVSRKRKGIIADLEWKKNFLKKAIQHQRDIIPVHVSGQNSDFFYNLANWRKRLGIKANIEMLYLADEMFKQKGHNLTIHFGEPIPWNSVTSSENYTKLAQKIKGIAYDLAKIS